MKKKPNINTFDIIQAKRMIGKGVVKPCKGVVINKKEMADQTKKIKDTILSHKQNKSISLTGYVQNGIIYIFKHLVNLFVIHGLSYSEIKKNNINIQVIIVQYPKLTKHEINTLI